MNIIQMQDDLKGLPDQELVNEVQNPSGVAPVYLLLGELQRREKMRAEFAGQQQPTQTIAEQIIDEAIAPAPPMPMEGSPIPPGPGQAIPPAGEVIDVNRMNEVVTPEGAEMTDTNMLASTGVGALPAPNVGQYAEGGVVGFAEGGFFGQGIKGAERRGVIEAVRPESQTAENYSTQARPQGLGGLAFMIKNKEGSPYRGFFKDAFGSHKYDRPGQSRLMKLIGNLGLFDQMEDQYMSKHGFDYPEYAQGGVVGFAPGGQTRITDPRDQKQLGEGYWEQFVTDPIQYFKKDVPEYVMDQLPDNLRQTIKEIPGRLKDQYKRSEEFVKEDVIQPIQDVYGQAEEVVEAFPYPVGYEEAGRNIVPVADPRLTGVTGDQYPVETGEEVEEESSGIGSLIPEIPDSPFYDTVRNIPDVVKEQYGKGKDIITNVPGILKDIYTGERSILGEDTGFGGITEEGTIPKKDKGKKDKKDKLPPGIDPDPDAKHWEDVAEKMNINKGQYQKLVEGQIADGGKSSYGDDKTLKDRTAEIEKMMHDMGIYDSKEDERAAKVAARIEREEARSAWNAVTMAGLSMMQGDSQFALTNIGKGIEDGIGAYEKSEQKIADLEDKKLELAEKKATRDRDKKIAALTLAVDIEKSNQTNMTNLLTASAKLENDIAIANANNIAKQVAAQIGADAKVEASLLTAARYTIENFYSNFKANNSNLTPGTNAWDVKFSSEFGNYLRNVQGQTPLLDQSGLVIESTTP
jgi:hypothetical protein